jgi:hypothetical protein
MEALWKNYKSSFAAILSTATLHVLSSICSPRQSWVVMNKGMSLPPITLTCLLM